jgi:hypothetical protein
MYKKPLIIFFMQSPEQMSEKTHCNKCRFCNKKLHSRIFYYSHMKIHVNPETKDQFSINELELIEKNFNQRSLIKKRSYRKQTVNPINKCIICARQLVNKDSFDNHLIVKHTKEQLLANGYTEETINALQLKRDKRVTFLKNYKPATSLNEPFNIIMNMVHNDLRDASEGLLLLSSS